MLKHLTSPMREMAEFAYASGWRREEIRVLRWEAVDRTAREVRLYDSKNGEPRFLPLDADLWATFERLWSAREFKTRSGDSGLSEYVFHFRGRPISDGLFTYRWNCARTKAGAAVAGKIFHDYRRTAARDMIRAGVPQAVAKTITGHKTDSMFQRYNIVSAEDKRDALQKRGEYAKKQQPKTNVAAFRKAQETEEALPN